MQLHRNRDFAASRPAYPPPAAGRAFAKSMIVSTCSKIWGLTNRAMLKRIIGFIVLAAVGFAGGHLIRVMFSHEHPTPVNESPVSNHN
jgi:hypothetical protein